MALKVKIINGIEGYFWEWLERMQNDKTLVIGDIAKLIPDAKVMFYFIQVGNLSPQKVMIPFEWLKDKGKNQIWEAIHSKLGLSQIQDQFDMVGEEITI